MQPTFTQPFCWPPYSLIPSDLLAAITKQLFSSPRSLDLFAGITQQLFVDWLSLAFNPAAGVAGMEQDIIDGKFAGDDLLARVQADLNAFYWQSHTLTHLARDNIGANDCAIEDGGGFPLIIQLSRLRDKGKG